MFEFCDLVRGRVPVVPLVEKQSAARDIDRILSSDVVSEFHIGMNDLALDIGLSNHYELWESDIVASIARSAQKYSKKFGVGGVTDPRCEGLDIDPAWIIGQQARLGSSSALLGRHFKHCAVHEPNFLRMKSSVVAIRDCFSFNFSK